MARLPAVRVDSKPGVQLPRRAERTSYRFVATAGKNNSPAEIHEYFISPHFPDHRGILLGAAVSGKKFLSATNGVCRARKLADMISILDNHGAGWIQPSISASRR
jgi:hypothetical protein